MEELNKKNCSELETDVAGIREIELNLPEDEGEGLGFRLTRTLWDPYPWVREVTPESRADEAGLKTGDCLLQAEGRDLLGLPIGQVAGLIRGDGAGRGVSLLVWNCGVDPKDDPELLWSCGGGSRGERSRRALEGVVKALSCCVCAATATKALNCARSHLYCEACWTRLERCALCRETLPAKDSPYARNLVAEQVFEAIAKEYELKNSVKKSPGSSSAYTSPVRSPNMSPATTRRGYQLSMMNRTKKTVQFIDKPQQSYSSDPNIHKSSERPSNSKENTQYHNKCTNKDQNIQTDMSETCHNNLNSNCNLLMQHKLVTRLRQACSLADLQKGIGQNCTLSQSLTNINIDNQSVGNDHSSSLDSLKNNCSSSCGSPVFLLPVPPVYVVTCDHSLKE